MVISSFLALPVNWATAINGCFLVGFYIRIALLYSTNFDLEGVSRFYVLFSYYLLITSIVAMAAFIGREVS